MTTRRGTRIVTGYVVSHSGKRGGPWEANGPVGTSTTTLRDRTKWVDERVVYSWLSAIRHGHPSARVLPVVRYELDREEERLRDAVVEACLVHASWTRALVATDELRAHLEKKR